MLGRVNSIRMSLPWIRNSGGKVVGHSQVDRYLRSVSEVG